MILGKTNLSEWANFRSIAFDLGLECARRADEESVRARSQCLRFEFRNGSAIAARLATVGVGTETDGSIICPASVTGLVGLKPTIGLVSRNGIIPISRSQDTAGPMTRSVADAAVLLAAMVGRDEGDAATANSIGRAVFDYPLHLRADGLRGARIGVLRQKMGAHADVDAAMERAIAAMRRAGAVVVDAEIPTEGQWETGELDVLLCEFKAGLEHYLTTSEAPVRTLAEIIDFNKRHAGQEMTHFGQDLFEQADAKGPLNDPAYLDTRSNIRQLAGRTGHRCRAAGTAAGCADRTGGVGGMGCRHDQRRSHRRRGLRRRGRRRLPQPDRADGRHPGTAVGHRVHGHRVERTAD